MQLMFKSIKIALHERYRQINEEGWTPEHDLHEHERGDLARAAACYLVHDDKHLFNVIDTRHGGRDAFPFEDKFDKRDKHSEFKRLVIGATLALAEIDRYINEAKERGINHEEMLGIIDDADASWNTEIINGVRKYLKNQAGTSRPMGRQAAADVQGREHIINRVESTYPPDNHHDGHDVIVNALANAWRELPMNVLRHLDRVCEAKLKHQQRIDDYDGS